jgi:3D (Asp-Asp-Asp) domain-containing protein
MVRHLSGLLAALWLLGGLADMALAAKPRHRGTPRTHATRARLLKKPRLAKKTPKKGKTRKRVARVPRRYIRSFRALVTAYVPINTPMEGGRWTCTMRDGWKTHGIAVDPRYIPLGSLLYVPGYGRALADDTGGRIKGRHIDVRQHSVRSMHRWGVKKLRVYVLKHPKKKKRVRRVLSA